MFHPYGELVNRLSKFGDDFVTAGYTNMALILHQLAIQINNACHA